MVDAALPNLLDCDQLGLVEFIIVATVAMVPFGQTGDDF